MNQTPAYPISKVLQAWWPLAASWLLMGAELPLLSAVVARLPDPKIHLAAYGGVVFPLALIIESPIIMLLAASTALSRDWDSYRRLYRYMMTAGALLTALHVLIAFTPLYDVVAQRILGAPAEILEPGRIGLMLMTPWTWSIAYRRFHQGVLIRFNRSHTIGVGTVVRMSANALTLWLGYSFGWAGIVTATAAVSAGVLSEALYVGLVVRPVLGGPLRQAPPAQTPVTWPSFIYFYIPLVLTSLLTLLVQPIGSAAISRMPLALESLAAWPVVNGLVFLLRSMGVAYNEVVVALLDQPGSATALRRFSRYLSLALTLALLLVAATPLSELWFGRVSGLAPDLTALAVSGLWWALPLPWLAVLQSWYQGLLVNRRDTRPISEAVAAFLLLSSLGLALGVWLARWPGLVVGMAAFSLAMLGQTAWLWYRSRPHLSALRQSL